MDKKMQYTVAIALVVISLSAAEPQRPRYLVRQHQQQQQQQQQQYQQQQQQQQQQQPQPYAPSGFQPQGPPFPPQQPEESRGTPQVTYGAPPPFPSYGPPPEEVPETTETFDSSTEEVPDVEPLAEDVQPSNLKKSSSPSKLKKEPSAPGAYFIVLPQSQNYVVVEKNSPLVAVPSVEKSAPLVAVPAIPAASVRGVPAKVVSARIVEPYSLSSFQAFPVAAPYSSGYTSVITPFSSFVQVN